MPSPVPPARLLRVACAAALTVSGLVGAPALAGAATNPPPTPLTPDVFSAVSLPAPQVNGVVWSQAVAGDLVWVGGRFWQARPAGAAPNTNEVTRNNFLAYHIKTGALHPINLNANGQIYAVAASPDGKTVYLGGDFTTLNGVPYYRLAAIDVATGKPIPGFKPSVPYTVRAIAPLNDRVYFGGSFSAVNNVPRYRLAAVRAGDGALLDWAPNANDRVHALAITPDGSGVIAGGAFSTINGSASIGMANIDAVTGLTRRWNITNVVRNRGPNAAITSLYNDGSKIVGTGYSYQATNGNFEGTFAADPTNGDVVWLNDCHGDSYSVYATAEVAYQAGHSHYCGNIGGFGEAYPDRIPYNVTAMLNTPSGTIMPNTQESVYTSFTGQPATKLLNFFPMLSIGSFTGQDQSTWHITGNGEYLLVGGEFPVVNGVGQQGLARFQRKATGSNTSGPFYSGSGWQPKALQTGAGRVKVTWQANRDKDDPQFRYEVWRSDITSGPVHRTGGPSTFWSRPTMAFQDSGLSAGRSYTYTVYAIDPAGNRATSAPVSITVADASPLGVYRRTVEEDMPQYLWRLSSNADAAGFTRLTSGSMSYGATGGAISGDSDGAARLTSAGPFAEDPGTGTAMQGPQTFTVEGWVKSVNSWFSKATGRILGFSATPRDTSLETDRNLYVDSNGRLAFGVQPGGGSPRTVRSPSAVNDGAWHHVAASIGDRGMELYVDGTRVATDASVTSARILAGNWRFGTDDMSGWPSASSRGLSSYLDEFAIYHRQLGAEEIQAHYQAARGGNPANQAPTASFTTTVDGATVSFDGSASSDPDGQIASYAWDFGDGATGTGAEETHTYQPGTYTAKLTVTDNRGATASTTRTVTVTAPEPPGVGALGADAFGRSVTGGWGSADTGGAYQLSGSTASFSVDGSVARMSIPAASTSRAAYLPGASGTTTWVSVDLTSDKVPAGGVQLAWVTARRVGTSAEYGAKMRRRTDGAVEFSLYRTVGATESLLKTVTLTDLGWAASVPMTVKVEAEGSSPTTLRAKIWKRGTTEPAAWQVTTTDATAGLQAAGYVGLRAYLASTVSNTPVVYLWDNLSVPG